MKTKKLRQIAGAIKKKRLKVWSGVIGIALAVALVLTLVPVGITITGEGMLGISLRAAEAQEVGELVGLRTLTSKTYYLGNNTYSLDASIGSVHYQNATGEWQEIDNSWQVAQAPWDWEMLEDGYHTRVLEDFTYGQILLFESQEESIAFQPIALEWTNDLDQIEQISMPQSVAVNVTNEAVELLPGMAGNISTIRWANGYGTGRHFEWSNTPGRLAKLLTLDSIPPIPEQYIIDGGNPVLRLNFIFDPSKDLGIYVDGVLWNRVTAEQSFNTIEFKKEGEVLWGFTPAAYWDSSGNITAGSGIGTTELQKSGGKLYVSVRVPYAWLQAAAYPVYIDPTLDLQVGASTHDASQLGTGTMTLNAVSIFMLSNYGASNTKWGGFYWASGSFPSIGDEITVAYAELYLHDGNADNSKVDWHFQLSGSPAVFSSSNYDISGRSRTTAKTAWIQDNIGVGWKQIPSLVNALQEVIDSYSPTSVVLIAKPYTDVFEKHLTCRSYDGFSSQAAKLHIEWTVPCSEDISNTPSSWSVNSGTPVDTSSTYTTGLTHFQITNNSGGAVDISIQGTDMTGGNTWTLSDTATPGSMTYGLKAGLSGGDYTIIVKKNSPYNDLVTGLADSGTQQWGLKLYTPTVHTDGAAKTGTTTITATCV